MTRPNGLRRLLGGDRLQSVYVEILPRSRMSRRFFPGKDLTPTVAMDTRKNASLDMESARSTAAEHLNGGLHRTMRAYHSCLE
jgi:hypothetical protein